MTTEALIGADFVYPPFDHQLIEFENHVTDRSRAFLWQMRTGKTKATIDTACHWAVNNDLDAVIVLAPNGVHRNWVERELPRHHWRTVPYRTLYWNSEVAGQQSEFKTKAQKQERDKWWDGVKEALSDKLKLRWFAFASETVTRDDVRRLIARIMRRCKNVMLVVDESDDYGKPGSKKTKMVRALSKRCKVVRMLTGTVVENSPLRAYSQYEILQEGALGFSTFEEFEQNHADYQIVKPRGGRPYPKLKNFKNLDQLRNRMSKLSSVVLRNDVNDMPDLVRLSRTITLSDEQLEAYREAYETAEITLPEVTVDVLEALLIRLQQVTAGYVGDEFGDIHRIPGSNPREQAAVEEVLGCSGKTILWCAFREEMDSLVRALKREGLEVLEYHGRTSEADRAKVRKALAPDSDSKAKALVAHPRAAGRGLDLSGADRIVWVSHTFDAVLRSQADERATAVGGSNVELVDLVTDIPSAVAPINVDRYVLQTLERKRSVAEDLARSGLRDLLAIFKENNDNNG